MSSEKGKTVMRRSADKTSTTGGGPGIKEPPVQEVADALRSGFAAHDRRILLLQGGGALGAYHAGVYDGLATVGFAPDWVVGISIGAINAALIAGPAGAPERPTGNSGTSSSRAPIVLPAAMDFARPVMNRLAAASAMFFGIPGFFVSRMPVPQLAPEGTLAALSYYDTEPLRATLERLVDFDRINAGDFPAVARSVMRAPASRSTSTAAPIRSRRAT